jgi:hypothetical protein
VATFQVTTKDGAVYEVDAPEGTSEEEIMQQVQKQHESSSQGPYGAKSAGMDVANFTADAANRVATGYGGRVASDFTGNMDLGAQGVGDILEHPFGSFKEGNVLTGIPRMALGGVGAAASPVSAAIAPYTDQFMPQVAGFVDEHLGKPIEDATGYPSDITTPLALQLATAGVAKGVRGSLPKTSVAHGALAHEMMQNDVPVYPGQLANSKMLRNAYDMADQVSIYDNGANLRQGNAIARMEARPMGEDTTNLRDAVGAARNRLSGVVDPNNPLGPKLQPGEYDQTYARIGDHPIDSVALNEMATLDQRAAALSDRSSDTVRHAIDNVMSAVRNGTLSIRAFKDLTDHGGPLTELANSPHETIATYGRQLRGVLERNIMRQASPRDAAALRQHDSQWRHMSTLAGPVERMANAEGQLSPGRMQGDLAHAPGGGAGMPDYQTIARAGGPGGFLRKPTSSGTAERKTIAEMAAKPVALISGGVGAGALAANAPGAIIGGALAIGGPLAFRGLMQRQWLARMMIDESQHRGANPNATRRMLTNAARDASLTVPAAAGASNAQRKRMLTKP